MIEVTLSGNLGTDPRVMYTPSQIPVLDLSISDEEKKQNCEKKTYWHKVKVWREKALELAENTKKGDRLLIRGELKYDSYQDGEKSHKSYYILAREIARV